MFSKVPWPAIFWPVIVGVCLLVAWYLAIWLFDIPQYQLPKAHVIVEAMFKERELLLSGGAQTTIACMVGFFISVTGGLALSLFLASSKWAFDGIYPYILILKMTPIIVLAPIIILWAGQGLCLLYTSPSPRDS